MDFFPVDTLSIKTADILSRYYSSVTRLQEQIKADNEPETNSDPSQLGEEPSGPTYKRHKIFDPVRRKNIWVPNKRLYDPLKIPKVHCSNYVPWPSQSSLSTGLFTEMNQVNESQQRFLSLPTQDHVKKDSIHIESLRKQRLSTERLASYETKYHINPYSQGDRRVDHPTVEGELSRYMSSYWRVVTDAPASNINLKKRAVPCHRLHLTSS